MDQQGSIPEAILKIQHSLQPFIKSRQKITQIRRIAASRLNAQLAGEEPLSRPLSLIDFTCTIDGSSHGIRGLQRDYLKYVRSNLKARREYLQLKKELQGADYHDSSEHAPQQNHGNVASKPSTEFFIDLVKKRQMYERLRIIQDYIELLSQKPAAGAEHLDPKVALKDVDSLPKVPPEVMNIVGSHQRPAGADLRELVDKLEKSVLRAKMLLWREQKLLTKVKHKQPASHGNRLQALASTRNELINWIETELATAAESSGTTEELSASSELDGEVHIESELTSIQRQYLRYTKARQSLILTSTLKLTAPPCISENMNSAVQDVREMSQQLMSLSTIYPYLEKMVGISNDQKALIQQKSYLTVSLAKQLKEANQGIDRLAEESHLLPAHPIPAGQGNGPEKPVSFGDTIANSEVPDSSRRALAWVHASNSAQVSIQRSVSKKVEEGYQALKSGRESMLDLQCLLGKGTDFEVLGEDSQSKLKGAEISQDIWSILDGNLGAIKGDGLDI